MSDSQDWFRQARFGVFVHWGLYSLLQRGEWVMLTEQIPVEDYARLAEDFNPDNYQPEVWAKLAVDAGAKYMVLTTRHHDGFCLFDSRTTDFTAPRTAARRDLIAGYVEACRKAGLKVGLYYSLLDWRFPGYHNPQRYPDNAEQLVQQAHDQVRELMTNYGRIDLLWYDGGWGPAAQTTEPHVFWRAQELNAMVRELQPGIVINDRSGLPEDFSTPEQQVVPAEAGRMWETCMTMGDACGWGYTEFNSNWKAITQLIQVLVATARDGGNLLLNMGPQPDGDIRREERERLLAIGGWLRTNGEAIYGSDRSRFNPPVALGRPNNQLGEWTQQGHTAYWHLFRWPGEQAVCSSVASTVRKVTLLANGVSLDFHQEYNGRLVVSGLPAYPPHPAASVLRVEFDEEPRLLQPDDDAAWLWRGAH